MNHTQIGLNSLYIMHIRHGVRAAEGRSFYFTFNSMEGKKNWGSCAFGAIEAGLTHLKALVKAVVRCWESGPSSYEHVTFLRFLDYSSNTYQKRLKFRHSLTQMISETQLYKDSML